MGPESRQTTATLIRGRFMAIDSDERPWLVFEQVATVDKLPSDVYSRPRIVGPRLSEAPETVDRLSGSPETFIRDRYLPFRCRGANHGQYPNCGKAHNEAGHICDGVTRVTTASGNKCLKPLDNEAVSKHRKDYDSRKFAK
jgi:hypothetical protein